MSLVLLLAAAGILYFISTGKINLNNVAANFRLGATSKDPSIAMLQDPRAFNQVQIPSDGGLRMFIENERLLGKTPQQIMDYNAAKAKESIINQEFLKTGRLLG